MIAGMLSISTSSRRPISASRFHGRQAQWRMSGIGATTDPARKERQFAF